MPDSLTPLEEKREVHLLDYWRTIWRGRWTILSIFVVVVAPVKETGIVEISMEGLNPEEVATWVNTISEVYVDRNLDQVVEATSKAVKALLSEIAPLREKLEDTQRTSFEFAEKANLYVP